MGAEPPRKPDDDAASPGESPEESPSAEKGKEKSLLERISLQVLAFVAIVGAALTLVGMFGPLLPDGARTTIDKLRCGFKDSCKTGDGAQASSPSPTPVPTPSATARPSPTGRPDASVTSSSGRKHAQAAASTTATEAAVSPVLQRLSGHRFTMVHDATGLCLGQASGDDYYDVDSCGSGHTFTIADTGKTSGGDPVVVLHDNSVPGTCMAPFSSDKVGEDNTGQPSACSSGKSQQWVLHGDGTVTISPVLNGSLCYTGKGTAANAGTGTPARFHSCDDPHYRPGWSLAIVN